MFYQLDNQKTLTVYDEKYGQWPNFFADVAVNHVLHSPLYMTHILQAENLICAAWRDTIPINVRRQLDRHGSCHTELLELAQLDPERFLDLATSNPALTLAIATYWALDGSTDLPSRSERDQVRLRLIRLKRRQILGELGYPATNEIVRILEKIPVDQACVLHVRNVLDLCRRRGISRRLRHLPEINVDVGSLLAGRPPIFDMGVLRLAATSDVSSNGMVRHMVRSIVANRERAYREPVWPYHGEIKTFDQLAQAERLSAWLAGNPPELLPSPPLDSALAPAPLKLEALHLRSAVKEEAQVMSNCLLDHLRDMCCRRSYAYRLTSPERGTVLIQREGNHWVIGEAMLERNQDTVSPHTMHLLERWITRANATPMGN